MKGIITKILILSTGVIWVLYDMYAYLAWGNPATESATIWRYSYYYPGIAFLAGVLCGHFFFQMHEPTAFPTGTALAKKDGE